MRHAATFLFFLLTIPAFTQIAHPHLHDRAISFPDLTDYKTVVCDFHIHSVFSDGSVWPDIRVQEALRDSVDMISLTEHLEYQPHRSDLPHPDRNRSFELASQLAKPYGLEVVHGAEITRSMPPGHNNAIFIQDASALQINDSIEVFREANRQGAFVFWNHPNWIAQRKDGIARITPTHEFLIKEKLLHGIEVVNDLTYSDEALQIALDNDLAIIGTSDIHGLVDWQYNIAEGGHRPVTLVLANDHTQEAVKEAMFDLRTIAWFENTLIGREAHLVPLLETCISVVAAEYIGPTTVVEVTFHNDSDAEFMLLNRSDYTFHANGQLVTLAPNGTTKIEVKIREPRPEFKLSFEVLNAIIAPGTAPTIEFTVAVSE